MRDAVTIALMSLAVASAARAQTTTTCADTYYGMPKFGRTCRTSAPDQPVAPEAVTPKPCSFADRYVFDIPPSTCEARAVAAKRKAIGELLADGRCDDAIAAALATGDLQYAAQVRAYCGR